MKQSTVTLVGKIQKLIDRSLIKEMDQAQISVAGADYLYDALRIPNILGWQEGKSVEVTIRLI
jgi:hypothetical protein